MTNVITFPVQPTCELEELLARYKRGEITQVFATVVTDRGVVEQFEIERPAKPAPWQGYKLPQ